MIIERDAKGGGLTRPEVAVLMAYAKIALAGEIVDSDVPDDAYLSRDLRRYFPRAMQERFGADIDNHRLRREIIATMLSNSMINRGGPAFVSYVTGETHARAADIAAAFAVARDSFSLLDIASEIDALDAKIPGIAQNRLYAGLQHLLRWTTIWFLRMKNLQDGLEFLIARYRDGIAAVEAALEKALPAADLAVMANDQTELTGLGVPASLAQKLIRHRFLRRAPDNREDRGDQWCRDQRGRCRSLRDRRCTRHRAAH